MIDSVLVEQQITIHAKSCFLLVDHIRDVLRPQFSWSCQSSGREKHQGTLRQFG